MTDPIPNRVVYHRNGDSLGINDHVYCSPKWQLRDGTPYSVARIMAFLPAEGAPPPEPGKPVVYTRVRLAWYYRPSDVSDRPVSDSRLLLAAIYSEVTDINQIRGKCFVLHRDKIHDLATWKKKPDRFYFNKLFDPYIKKEFEIIQSTEVRNIPDNIRDTLISRYEYVVTEREFLPDLTDNVRLCDSCQLWCPGQDSVQCDRCKQFHHMGCVQPPLTAKPARGYGWTCAPCARKHDEEVDGREPGTVSQGKPRSNAQGSRPRGRPRKDRSGLDPELELTESIKHFKMWPFRYFGQYTVAEDTLHEEDLIWPKTATRHGPKYQANVAPTVEQSMSSRATDIPERGDNATIEVLSCLDLMTETEKAEMDAHMMTLTSEEPLRYNVDWLTEAIRRFSDAFVEERPLTDVRMEDLTRRVMWGKTVPLLDKDWTKEEAHAFEEAIGNHGAELRAVREDVITRTMPEVVRYYGHWKCSKLKEENMRIREQRRSSKPGSLVQSRRQREMSTMGGLQKIGYGTEGSVISSPSKSATCGACRTKESAAWWKAPKGISSNVLCHTCGMNWRKYADLNVRTIREDSTPANKTHKGGDKREGTPLEGPKAKRLKTTVTSSSATPPPPPNIPQIKCLACNKNGPVGKVLKCKKCGFRCHAGTCGAVVEPSELDSWLCDICHNEDTLDASVYPRCLLCPRNTQPVVDKAKGKQVQQPHSLSPIPPDSFLRACKPTEGSGWAHILCATFIPEVQFTDSKKLRLVENINVIYPRRWETKCSICNEEDGAVIQCKECAKEYHVSCAWRAGYKFGFEILPVKSSRREQNKTVTFKGETGSMSPITICKDHDTAGRRDIYGICQTDGGGGETALQVFCQTYKQASVSQGHGLLRKAQRLDTILASLQKEAPSSSNRASIGPQQPSMAIDKKCSQCATEFTPMFYAHEDGHLCHQCHYSFVRMEQEWDKDGDAKMNGAAKRRKVWPPGQKPVLVV